MIHSSCHCGAVRLTVPRAPSDLTDCNCTICRRYGTLWGYYSPKEVAISGATDVYQRGERSIEFHRCKLCGCVTHWAPADKAHDRMGVNFRMMEPSALAGVRVRKLDGFDTWKFLDE
ncbi:MAG TPA: GFA family protein [Polyangiaceae bacterium]